MITPEQTESIKNQLMQHIEKGFPKDKQEFAKNQIRAMNSEQLEEFLKQNNISTEDNAQTKCIFCSIVSEKIKSYKIGENEEAIAVLDINPISKAHSIIIPKKHTPDFGKEPSKATKTLIEEISEKIKKNLKPKNITIENTNLFGHQIINLIPNYEGEDLVSPESPRNPAKPEELLSIQEILLKKEKKIIKESKPKEINLKKEKFWLPKRIP